MDDDKEPRPDSIIPANDNQGPGGESSKPDRQTCQQVDQVVLTIARLIGRRIAREHFAALSAANDNGPSNPPHAEDGADED